MEVACTVENLTSEIVSNLTNGSSLLGTEDIRKNYCSLLDKVKEYGTLATTGLKLLNTVCGYLFDPEEGFIALKTQIISLIAILGKMLGLRDDIPEDIKPKLEEIQKYLEKSKKLIATMEKEIDELLKVSVLLLYGLEKDLCLATKV